MALCFTLWLGEQTCLRCAVHQHMCSRHVHMTYVLYACETCDTCPAQNTCVCTHTEKHSCNVLTASQSAHNILRSSPSHPQIVSHSTLASVAAALCAAHHSRSHPLPPIPAVPLFRRHQTCQALQCGTCRLRTATALWQHASHSLQGIQPQKRPENTLAMVECRGIRPPKHLQQGS
jgi:hypothetical protein